MLLMAFDGGGARAVIPARHLATLHGILPPATLYAGTSAGSIIACLLAMGTSPDGVQTVMRAALPRIFADGRCGLVRPRHSSSTLRAILRDTFASVRMGDLPGRVMVSTVRLVDTGGWHPTFIDNLPDSPHLGLRVIDAVMRSCAAPVYFGGQDDFADGGLAANNPAMCALALALNPARPLRASLPEVHLLSFGTGRSPRQFSGMRRAGLLQWAPHLLPLVMDGAGDVADYQARQLLGGRYMRVQPTLPHPIALDDWHGAAAFADALPADCGGPVAAWLRGQRLAN